MKQFDTVVIGAGAAGLCAAYEFARAGRSVCLLEARDRVGGRCWSIPIPGSPVELGAEFIHGAAAVTHEVLRESGQLVVDAPDAHWHVIGSRLQQGGRAFEQITRAFTGARTRKDRSFADLLASLGPRALPPEARTRAQMIVEGLDAADPQLISANEVIAEWTGDLLSDQQARPLGGYGPMMSFLAHKLTGLDVTVKLRSVVTDVQWRKGRVVVRVSTARGAKQLRGAKRSREITARRAILAVPLEILRPEVPGAIRFDPPLDAKRWALDHLATGPALKLVLEFAEPFWETVARGRYRDASFFHDGRGHFPTFWTSLPLRTSSLTAWAGGPRVDAMSGLDAYQLADRALTDLRRIFKVHRSVPKLQSVWFHDWQLDPFARGAYSYVKTGGGQARRKLAAPLAKTLYFAGEATDYEGEATTVAGAIASARRVARQILS